MYKPLDSQNPISVQMPGKVIVCHHVTFINKQNKRYMVQIQTEYELGLKQIRRLLLLNIYIHFIYIYF